MLTFAWRTGDNEWREGEVVTGVAYRTPDGVERRAGADLTVACDGMYSALRTKLTVSQARVGLHQ